MLKKILTGIGLVALMAAVFYGTRSYYTISDVDAKEQSQVLLEKIKTVAKLVTVEGYFSEIYSYEDYWKFDLGMFQKRALIRVKGKVSVGYDLSKMNVEALPLEKTLIISNLPDPEIISLEHDLDYYDITEGTFNSFTKDDYNRMNKNAKDMIKNHDSINDLYLAAESQNEEMIDLIRFMAEGSGWKVRFLRRGEELIIDSLKN